MNIIVCISRVPDTASRITIGSDGKSIEQKGIKYVVNPYDEFAIEEGLRLREKHGGTVTAVTVSGEAAKKDILLTSLAMGVDSAVLIKSEEIKDSWFVAKNLADYAKDKGADLILMGRQSVDYDSLQLPSSLAELLNMPSVSVVSKLDVDGDKVSAERDIEGGKETVEAKMPCIISAQKGLNDPRYPKLPDIMKAKRKPIEVIDAADEAPRVTFMEMSIPSKQRMGKVMGAEDSDIDEVVRLLHEEAKVI